jgi:hypothetical protein
MEIGPRSDELERDRDPMDEDDVVGRADDEEEFEDADEVDDEEDEEGSF